MIGRQVWLAAGDLPPQWDDMADAHFQRREFLAHCEQWNSCGQRYYGAVENGRLAACAVVYTLALDLLAFTRAKMSLRTQVIGIPCSVSSPGLFGDPGAVGRLTEELVECERGLLLALNLRPEMPIPARMTQGQTLPTIRMELAFVSWEDYLASLRSDYRRRIRNIEEASSSLRVEFEECSSYTGLHHELYLQVVRKSNSRLEQLTSGFFRNLPRPFLLMALRRGDRLEGWALILDDPGEFTFVFGGIDYGQNRENATYLRLLLEVLRRAVETGAGRIEFGQTAERPKLRLGGVLHPLAMAATHSNPLFRVVLRRLGGALEYRCSVPDHHVFRGAH